MSNRKTKTVINRRGFLRSTAVVGAGLAFSPMVLAQTDSTKKPQDINVAFLGCGAQGQVLMDACLKMGKNSGVRFKAVCDIWKAYNQKRVSGVLRAYKHEHNTYEDYKEMLDKEKGLDAVIVATPDFWHAEHAIACLKAGLHVYCEKEMSNTVESARKMVTAARDTGKLLQIGHQRRSNPRYIHCYESLIRDAKILGQITTINGQWNRSKAACENLGWPRKYALDEATLNKYGFKSMQRFRNWRWYKGLGGGPIVDLGSHQIDIYSWFLNTNPKSVIASGGIDYWKDHEWYDNVMAIFEYETKKGIVRAFYQTLTTNSNGGYFEQFMGDEGTLDISESGSRGSVYRESSAPEWDKWAKMGLLNEPAKKEEKAKTETSLDVRETVAPPAYELPVKFSDPYHQPHLKNFFDAVRGEAKLNCPAEIGYESAIAVLKVNEAVEAAKKLELKPEEFEV